MRKVLDPFPTSQNRPSLIVPTNPVEPVPTRAVNRWNFCKANWEQYTALVENDVNALPLPTTQNVEAAYAAYCKLLAMPAKQTIPRGFHQQYIQHGMRIVTSISAKRNQKQNCRCKGHGFTKLPQLKSKQKMGRNSSRNRLHALKQQGLGNFQTPFRA